MQKFIRPTTLIEGQVYLLRESRGYHTRSSTVIFVAHTSCPAFIIFSNGAGQKVRSPRSDLFLYADGNDE